MPDPVGSNKRHHEYDVARKHRELRSYGPLPEPRKEAHKEAVDADPEEDSCVDHLAQREQRSYFRQHIIPHFLHHPLES